MLNYQGLNDLFDHFQGFHKVNVSCSESCVGGKTILVGALEHSCNCPIFIPKIITESWFIMVNLLGGLKDLE